jgi:predicted GNAT superfamily acetyltransferase
MKFRWTWSSSPGSWCEKFNGDSFVSWKLRILESPLEMEAVEELQRVVWPGSETDIVPAHILLTMVHNGGLAIGAFPEGLQSDSLTEVELVDDSVSSPADPLVGFVFGFPGFYATPDGPMLKHCSHMLAIHPDYRNQGLGFLLKRAQWQMVRYQGLDRITWTYDPLLSKNAHLNIARLGAVCNTYLREAYGEMRDALNTGLPSDRFQVDWWVNTKRVDRRLSKKARLPLDLAHFLAAGAKIINPSQRGTDNWPRPGPQPTLGDLAVQRNQTEGEDGTRRTDTLILVEIPADFQGLKSAEPGLALEWRLQTRQIFETLFDQGYLVTDFIYLRGTSPRSYYVLSHGESTL